MQFIHGYEQGVIHEEIRPENILRDRQGQLYLTNFGAVKRVITETATRQALRSATSLAAPPEQQAGQFVPSSDLYSLAATMLRLLTHQDLQILFHSQTQRWDWRPYAQVSDRLGNVLDQMLQLNPSQRFQSAAEVLSKPNSPELAVQLIRFETDIKSTPRDTTLEISSKDTSTQLSSRSLSIKSSPRNIGAEEPIFKPLHQAAILGSGGWLVVAALASFLGTALASGLWILILAGVVFGFLAKNQPLLEKTSNCKFKKLGGIGS